jgi:hypothetical protein
VIYNIDHNISFERNNNYFEYTFENKTHKFYPDFIIGDIYYEIKGYMTPQQEAKISQFPHIIKLLCYDELQPYIDYVKSVYGNDFIRLYDGNPHNKKLNKCVICGNDCLNKYCSRKCAGIAVSNITHNKIS